MNSQLDGSDKCPICKTNFDSFERLHGLDSLLGFRIFCRQCGHYEVSVTGKMALAGEHKALLPYLSAHTRQAWEFEHRMVQINSNWPELAESHQHTSVHQRAE